jgi:vitamin B12 transporter
MRLVAFIFCISVLASGLMAQDMAPDTILNLNDVTIYSSRIHSFARGQAFQAIDSLTRAEYPAGSLAELVPGFSSVYIKNYGQGTLSTLSFRGTSANHTGLLWNGVQVAPPNIGYLDLSLVQGSFFDNISILYGGASPMFGSGSIGGGIHLENRPVFEKKSADAELGLSAGSFGTIEAEGKAAVYLGKVWSRTAFSVVNSLNDFSYKNLTGEEERSGHGRIFKSGFMQDLAVQMPGEQYLMASVWFQYAGRDIPPTLTEEVSEATQTDRSWRSIVLWKDYNKRNTLETRLAYFNEFTRYEDPSLPVYSDIHTQTLDGSFESTWDIGKNSALFAGTRFKYEYADLDYYDQPRNQENLAVYASYRYNFSSLKWQASFNARQEFFTDYQAPFLFSAGAEGRIWRFISGRLNISRNFRAPTFNEKYWVPGGNPELQPEESWNEEAGITFEKQFSVASLKFIFTGYNSRVENWILWLPGPSYWSVENAQEVWSRGFEISGNQSANAGTFNFFFFESYTFSKSTNEKKLFDLDASYKKQLIYTPLHRLVVKTGAIYKGFNLTIKGNFTGEVYSTKDNTESLPSYFLMDAVISKSIKIKNKYPLTIQMNFNNILNTDYQVITYRPMPGFGFLFTVKAGVVESR